METPWADLSHAYGPADDIPGLLRAMESEDADVREQAWHDLFSALCHQGTVYDASAPAVPHLARLARHGPGHRRELLWLIGGIADGSAQPTVRGAARRAVAEVLPDLLPFAHDTDAEIRDAMVLLIAHLGHPYALPLLPLLRARLDAESDPEVREHVVTALALLEAGGGEWRHGLLADPAPRVRLAAAEDLLRTAELPLPGDLVDICARAYTADPHDRHAGYWPHPYRPFTHRLVQDDPEASLRALAQGVPLAHEITERWRDQEADTLPWVLAELGGQAWELYRLARFTCALPTEAHERVRERVLPYLDSADRAVRSAALTVLARAGTAEAVPEVVRLVEEAPGPDDTVRAVTAVAEAFGAQALPVARAVAGRLDAASPLLVGMLARYPEVAVETVPGLAALIQAYADGYGGGASGVHGAPGPAAGAVGMLGTPGPAVGAVDMPRTAASAIAVLRALGPAAGADGAEALRATASGDAASPVSMAAALAYHRVTGDPELALGLLRREVAGPASGWVAHAGELGPAAAPLLPRLESLLAGIRTAGGRGRAALAVWRVTGRTEDTVEPLARWLVGHRDWSGPGLPTALPALTAIGLLPRFAVDPLRKVAESRRRVASDVFVEGGPHPDYLLRSAVRALLDSATVLD
ncbi:hypothetical protein [Streptomyces camelliae]|uniref:PBS lyase n=1 Tax=Streptomyces camelliae TaxID=3004093 RepID=A0ABY7P9Z8_9ACTN|nr:hypothetical protein [Streptomyces sp. HUAS 2-6]WBO66734.1 hypothetical protein O1G22_29995 [Streptomyces sp. HUAS 2-6]